MVVDINFGYNIGDMVKFILFTKSENIFTGIVSERWYWDRIQIYRINCMEKGMIPYTVSAQLILEKIG